MRYRGESCQPSVLVDARFKSQREREIMSKFVVEEYSLERLERLENRMNDARESARAAIMGIEGFVSLITTEIDEQEVGEHCDLSSDFGELKGLVADLEDDIEKLKGDGES